MTVETTKMEAFFLCQKEARGDLGKTLIADSLSNTTINGVSVGILFDLSEFGFATLGPRDLNNLWIWRYGQSDDDELRKITSVLPAAGYVTVDREWDNTSDKNYVLIGLDPNKVLDAMDSGYQRLGLTKDVILTKGGADFDMEEDNEEMWNGYLSGMTVLKEQALPQNKVTGEWSLKMTLDTNNGSLLSEPIRAVPGDNLDVVTCMRVESGGAWTVRLWDDTHSAYFGDTQTYSRAEFAYLAIRKAAVPAGCDYWQLEIKGATVGGVAYLDSVSARAEDDVRFSLAPTIDESYKVPLIHRMRWNQSHQAIGNQYPATKMQPWGDLVYGTHYQLHAQHTEASPYVLEIEPTVQLEDDIFYLMTRRDRYMVEPWTYKTDVTTAPRGELLAFCMYPVADLLAHETKDAYWTIKAQEWGAMTGQEVAPRAEVPYQPQREVIRVKR